MSGSAGKTKTLYVRLPPLLKRAVQKAALAQGVSVNTYVTQAFEAYISGR